MENDRDKKQQQQQQHYNEETNFFSRVKPEENCPFFIYLKNNATTHSSQGLTTTTLFLGKGAGYVVALLHASP